MRTLPRLGVLLALSALGLLPGCGGDEPPKAPPPPPQPAATAPAAALPPVAPVVAPVIPPPPGNPGAAAALAPPVATAPAPAAADPQQKALSLLDQIKQSMLDKKWELGETAFQQLDGLKDQLPDSLQQKIKETRTAFDVAQRGASGGAFK